MFHSRVGASFALNPHPKTIPESSQNALDYGMRLITLDNAKRDVNNGTSL